MQDIKDFLKTTPNNPGVYQMFAKDGTVIYVGKAKNLKKRLSSYFNSQQKDLKTQALIKHVTSIDTTITRNENEALLLECNLIKKHKPRYNILLRDDKSYPYILITNEHPYPRIDFYRGVPKKNGLYFGPYPNSIAVRETIHLIQKVFQLRTCHDGFFSSRTRPCLQHQIGLCSGSCTGLISEEEYKQNVRHAILFLQGKNEEILRELTKQMEEASGHLQFELAATLRDQITKIREIRERQYVSGTHGDADIIGFYAAENIICIQLLIIRHGRILGSRSYFPSVPADSLQDEIIAAFITQHYLNQQVHEIPKEIILKSSIADRSLLMSTLSEHAHHHVTISHSVRGERNKWLEMATANAKQSVASLLSNKANSKERFVALQKLLNLEKLPSRIECFDISHTMGEATVASCVVFTSAGAAKSDYRRFNITDVTGGDDIGAMRQAILRRYKRLQANEEKLPSIVLIDGGMAQLHAAQSVLAELNITNILLVGVAKGVTRKAGLETLYIENNPPIHVDSDSLALHLIQQIRDEAHRFAITGHRQRRDKIRRTSTLEDIPGIGVKKRRELLRYFGGIQAINRASLDELAKVPGISLALAQKIFEAIHNVVV
ncbi:MAG: excinuclease ABC subunit UvrC [Gammaproteobacteria bacterium]|nr:excinuclease ABC subunit UvrC [Gammaproteobacteria bacterium]